MSYREKSENVNEPHGRVNIVSDAETYSRLFDVPFFYLNMQL